MSESPGMMSCTWRLDWLHTDYPTPLHCTHHHSWKHTPPFCLCLSPIFSHNHGYNQNWHTYLYVIGPVYTVPLSMYPILLGQPVCSSLCLYLCLCLYASSSCPLASAYTLIKSSTVSHISEFELESWPTTVTIHLFFISCEHCYLHWCWCFTVSIAFFDSMIEVTVDKAGIIMTQPVHLCIKLHMYLLFPSIKNW